MSKFSILQLLINSQVSKFSISLVAGTGLFFANAALAENTSFFIDSSYSKNGSTQVTASLQHEGLYSRWYVSDEYSNKISYPESSLLLSRIQSLSQEFDTAIYPKLRALFGEENNPGVDNDPKITVLVLEMIEEAGGYFREQDGLPKAKITGSNEREMIYLNVLHLGNPRARAFLAHEFQHLITFNQKFIKHGAQEEVWLNELRSELASTILGYDNPGIYGGSNLEARVKTFLKSPKDALLDWENESKDYAAINLFGQYLLDRYGRSVIAAMTGNNKVGIASFDEALRFFGFQEQFSDIFKNWTLAALINNCFLEPVNTYCYQNPSLDYNNFRIQFGVVEGSGKQIVSQNKTKDWSADWMKLEKKIEAEKPKEHIFMLQFYGALGSDFRVPYVIYGKDGETILTIDEIKIDEGGVGTFFVEEFGYTVPKVVIIPYNQKQKTGTSGNVPLTSFTFNASTIDEATKATYFTAPNTALVEAPSRLPDLPDGSLIRAEGDYKVYIIKNGYKRWIQSAEIFRFYGHLGFEVVNALPAETVALYKDAWLVRAEGDYKVYEINGDGTRHWLDISAEQFSASGRVWDMVYVINKSELLWYKEGPVVK